MEQTKPEVWDLEVSPGSESICEQIQLPVCVVVE